MDISLLSIFFWISFSVFILLLVAIVLSIASTIFLSIRKKVIKNTNLTEETTFGIDIEKEETHRVLP